ncbi:MAG: LPD7 domain-containing protein [Steroidobacteraceae bacterium]
MAKDTAASDSSPKERDRRSRAGRVAAEQTVNTVSPTPAARAPEPHEPPVGVRQTASSAQAARAERSGSAPETSSKNEAPAGFAAVPDRILDRYYRIGTKYYLDNGELAFIHHSDKLTTPSENSEIARDLVEIARHNGLRDITVTGTERFRREVWAAATRLGLEVRAYEPTLHDEKQLVRAMAREDAVRRGVRDEGRGAAPESGGSAAAAAGAAAPPAPSPSTRDRVDVPPAVDGPGADTAQAASTRRGVGDRRAASEGRTYAGELLDHGPEHYQRNPREDMSYYVQVGTVNGPIDLWGLDLRRALEEAKSRPRIGDRVVVRQTGQRDVTVRTREFDEAGRFLGERDKDTHRNRWSIEKEDFVRERARLAAVLRDQQVSAERGARAHPQLLGTYFTIKQAEEFAKERFRTREERQRFVDYTRERLAQIIERGESLPTTQIRSRQPERTRASSRESSVPQGPGPTLA